ncbi:TPA: hypothetical protein ACX6O7_000994 [Photobacterium damselae]
MYHLKIIQFKKHMTKLSHYIFLLSTSTFTYSASLDVIKELGNDLIINNHVFEGIIRDYQNDYVYLDYWDNKYAIIRETDSSNKERAIMTIDTKNNTIDCIYQSFYTTYTHIRLGRAVCNLDLNINDFEQYQNIMGKYNIDTLSYDNPLIIDGLKLSRIELDNFIFLKNKKIKYDDIFFMYDNDKKISSIVIEKNNKVSILSL